MQRIKSISACSHVLNGDLIEGVQAELSHRVVHCLDQVQQLSMPRTHFHPQKRPAGDNTQVCTGNRKSVVKPTSQAHINERMNEVSLLGQRKNVYDRKLWQQ